VGPFKIRWIKPNTAPLPFIASIILSGNKVTPIPTTYCEVWLKFTGLTLDGNVLFTNQDESCTGGSPYGLRLAYVVHAEINFDFAPG
jgi:hypothetical protein